jgi:hypothetical protein
VILDCYAFELCGLRPSISDVYEAATILRDDSRRTDLIIVCPDILKDGRGSFELLRDHGLGLSGYGRVMVVPHGASLHEWMSWADQSIDFCHNMGIGTPIIGLPRYMSVWGMSTRYKAATWLHHYYRARVHLLGAGQGLEEVLIAARAPSVMSCDSTAPFAYTMLHGIGNLASLQGTKVEMQPGWWHLDIGEVRAEMIWAAQINIALWKEALRSASISSAEPYSFG